MYTTVRQYAGLAPTTIDQMLAHRAEIEAVLRQSPGFVHYRLIRTATGLTGVTACADRAGAEESTRRVAAWIAATLPTLGATQVTIAAGEDVLCFAARPGRSLREVPLLTAQRLASCYDGHVVTLRAAVAFHVWLDGFWCPTGPPEPTGPPAAVAWVDGGQPAIRWHAAGPVLRGYVLGRAPGCFEVPADATLPESVPVAAVVFAA